MDVGAVPPRRMRPRQVSGFRFRAGCQLALTRINLRGERQPETRQTSASILEATPSGYRAPICYSTEREEIEYRIA